jgi:hypothetical protein
MLIIIKKRLFKVIDPYINNNNTIKKQLKKCKIYVVNLFWH